MWNPIRKRKGSELRDPYFEKVEQFYQIFIKYLSCVIIQNNVRIKLVNGHKLLTSKQLSRDAKLRISRKIILPIVYKRHKTWSLTLSDQIQGFQKYNYINSY